ncbi:MAG: hypothetical protein VX281_05865 [Pseudomonadota bacterium]|nr:hypothetical protein [Planctomycetota bacterium]MEE3190467.1 hypothetical protein [Pseudomonadota bacterium]
MTPVLCPHEMLLSGLAHGVRLTTMTPPDYPWSGGLMKSDEEWGELAEVTMIILGRLPHKQKGNLMYSALEEVSDNLNSLVNLAYFSSPGRPWILKRDAWGDSMLLKQLQVAGDKTLKAFIDWRYQSIKQDMQSLTMITVRDLGLHLAYSLLAYGYLLFLAVKYPHRLTSSYNLTQTQDDFSEYLVSLQGVWQKKREKWALSLQPSNAHAG